MIIINRGYQVWRNLNLYFGKCLKFDFFETFHEKTMNSNKRIASISNMCFLFYLTLVPIFVLKKLNILGSNIFTENNKKISNKSISDLLL